MADLEAVLADVSYLMAMEKSKCTPAARASKKIILPDPRCVHWPQQLSSFRLLFCCLFPIDVFVLRPNNNCCCCFWFCLSFDLCRCPFFLFGGWGSKHVWREVKSVGRWRFNQIDLSKKSSLFFTQPIRWFLLMINRTVLVFFWTVITIKSVRPPFVFLSTKQKSQISRLSFVFFCYYIKICFINVSIFFPEKQNTINTPNRFFYVDRHLFYEINETPSISVI